MRWNIVGAFIRNNPFGTEIAFRKGLERIGETVNIIDPSYPDQQVDKDADVNLIFKWMDQSPMRDELAAMRVPKIVYQVDDLRFPHIQQMMKWMLAVCDTALTFDEDGARLAMSYGYRRAQRLLLTADNELYKPIPGIRKDIDVAFIGSLSNGPNHASRVKMLELVRDIKGIRMAVGNEIFDIPRINEIYNRSRVVLNHATDVGQPFGHGYGYQCRHFEAGFAGATILSNTVDNDDALKNILTFHDEKSLVENLKELCFGNGLPEHLVKTTGPKLHKELTETHTPEHRARELVSFVRSL